MIMLSEHIVSVSFSVSLFTPCEHSEKVYQFY